MRAPKNGWVDHLGDALAREKRPAWHYVLVGVCVAIWLANVAMLAATYAKLEHVNAVLDALEGPQP